MPPACREQPSEPRARPCPCPMHARHPRAGCEVAASARAPVPLMKSGAGGMLRVSLRRCWQCSNYTL